MSPFLGSGVAGLAFAAFVGALLGWSLERAVGGWISAAEREWNAEGGRPRPVGRAVAVGFAAATVLLWWWEVRLEALLPRGFDGAVRSSPADTAVRWLAHSVLLWFLAAATWTDLRFRVIPDWITATGCITGLVAAWARPEVLLPVAALEARDFAAAIEMPDVLGRDGPLRASLDPAAVASPWALVAAAAAFAAWWWVATGPSDRFADGGWAGDVPDTGDDPDAGGGGAGPLAPGRFALLAAGIAGVAAAWWGGGLPFASLEASLAGVVVTGGLVWATRAGASLALGREAMGLGDVTLMAMAGAWLGWQACVLACFVGVLVGLAHGVWQMAVGRGSELPFGPSLCVGVAGVVAGWRPAWEATAESFAEPTRLAAVLGTVVGGTAVALFVWGALSDRARRAALAIALAIVGLLVAWMLAAGAV